MEEINGRRRSTRIQTPVKRNMSPKSYDLEDSSPEASPKLSIRTRLSRRLVIKKKIPEPSIIKEDSSDDDVEEQEAGENNFSANKREMQKSSIIEKGVSSDDDVGEQEDAASQPEQKNFPKTPQVVREKIKKHIQAQCLHEDSSSSEEHDISSEYNASKDYLEDSDTEEDSDSEDENITDSYTDAESESSIEQNNASKARNAEMIQPRCKVVESEPNVEIQNDEAIAKAYKKMLRSRKNMVQLEMKAEAFFASLGSKTHTSKNTLEKLDLHKLQPNELQRLLAKNKPKGQHKCLLEIMDQINKENFYKWKLLLQIGYNIILHGPGSKKELLQSFQKVLGNNHVVHVYGTFTALTLNDILGAILAELLDIHQARVDVAKALEVIGMGFKQTPNKHLYLIVHNIEMIQIAEFLDIICKLVTSTKNIHLIASMDHIKAPIMLSNSQMSALKLAWFDVTAFKLYTSELANANSTVVQNDTSNILPALRNVFQSLHINSRKIYLLLVKYQLEQAKDKYYQGMPLDKLYNLCRENFLVSSMMALRNQLREYLDHKVAKLKRSADGRNECVIIPIKNKIIQTFYEEQSTE